MEARLDDVRADLETLGGLLGAEALDFAKEKHRAIRFRKRGHLRLDVLHQIGGNRACFRIRSGLTNVAHDGLSVTMGHELQMGKRFAVPRGRLANGDPGHPRGETRASFELV